MKALNFEAWASLGLLVLLIVSATLPGGREQLDGIGKTAKAMAPILDSHARHPR